MYVNPPPSHYFVLACLAQLELTQSALFQHGLLVSTILIPAALSSIFTGHLANALGRLSATAIGSFIFGIGAAIECSSFHLPQLFIGRAVKGVGEGFFLSTLVVYITEISPPSQRGTLASLPQLVTTMGVLVGYFMCYGSVGIESSLSWRLPFAVQAIIAFLFTASTMLFLPQSPRWLAARGKFEEAERVWSDLNLPEKEREKVDDDVDDNEKADQEVKAKDMLAIFAPDAWKRTVLGLFLMGIQQAAGIDGVLYVCVSNLLLYSHISKLTKSVRTPPLSIRRLNFLNGLLSRFGNFRPPDLRYNHPNLYARR